jgi:hypothetical protein
MIALINSIDKDSDGIEPSDKDAEMAETEYTVPRLAPHQIRNERIAIAYDMVLRTLRDTASLPVREQQSLREVVKHLQHLTQWCRTHGPGL